MAIVKTVSITKEQEEWLIKNDKGLSGYLQEKINEDIAIERMNEVGKE